MSCDDKNTLHKIIKFLKLYNFFKKKTVFHFCSFVLIIYLKKNLFLKNFSFSFFFLEFMRTFLFYWKKFIIIFVFLLVLGETFTFFFNSLWEILTQLIIWKDIDNRTIIWEIFFFLNVFKRDIKVKINFALEIVGTVSGMVWICTFLWCSSRFSLILQNNKI
jgi:hypothetical protein